LVGGDFDCVVVVLCVDGVECVVDVLCCVGLVCDYLFGLFRVCVGGEVEVVYWMF